MDSRQLDHVLKNHKIWLISDGKEGVRADLAGADLVEANLRGSDLISANLVNTCVISATLGKHFAFYHEGYLKIGCESNTLEWWLENYERMGKEANYSDQDIKMYGWFIKGLKGEV